MGDHRGQLIDTAAPRAAGDQRMLDVRDWLQLSGRTQPDQKVEDWIHRGEPAGGEWVYVHLHL